MKKITLLLILTFFVVAFSFSQADFSLDNKAAFEAKLSEMGFLQVMKVKEIYNDADFYILRLQFTSDSQDENQAAWTKMQTEFKKENAVDLSEYLYFLFINFFQITEPQKVLLEIRHSYLTEECPFIRYYYDDEMQEFTLIETFCKAEIPFEIKLKELQNLKEEFVLKNKEQSKEIIYTKLLERFKVIYTNERGGFEKKSNSVFISRYRKGNNQLEFEVKDLQKEVLTQAGENFVYSMLTFLTGESYLPFEHLKFTIHYDMEKQQMTIKLEGRYGSGLHGNKEWSGMTDMDKGFPVFIDNYLKDKIMPEIIRTITNDKNYGKNN